MWVGGKREEVTSPASMQVGAIPSIKMALDKGAKSVVLMSFFLGGGRRWVWSSTSQSAFSTKWAFCDFFCPSLSLFLLVYVFPFSIDCLLLPWKTKFRNEAIWEDPMASPTQRTQENMEIKAMAVAVCVKVAFSNTYNIHKKYKYTKYIFWPKDRTLFLARNRLYCIWQQLWGKPVYY